ncbi:unnamed protein product [Lactuca virosa]|uniref:DUF4253 domain-containing protein n=1 Tax=Lactuca virosa TaxID=75947 RepID=A0AAU9NM99_9ASTR|nr:unnamed protein product [Lactuca virosa]
MGCIYEAMDMDKEAIHDSFSKPDDYNTTFYKDVSGVACEEVEKGLYDCIMRLVPEQQDQDKISKELDKYQNAQRLFVDWWEHVDLQLLI